MEFEVKIIEYLQAGGSDFWTAFFKAVSLLGTYVSVVALLIVSFFICRKKFVLIGGTLGVGLILNIILKAIINRPRPYVTNSQIKALVEETGASFPSLHAVCATILAICLCYLVFCHAKKKITKILIVFVALIAVALVCVSRMYLGVHYFTDVCAGVAVGSIISSLCLLCYKWFLERWLSKIKFLNKKEKKKDDEGI